MWNNFTTKGEQFLLFDNGKRSSSRMLIFSTSTNLDLLNIFKLWLADGTFKTAAQFFYQQYAIYGFSNGRVSPCVYALLSNKNEQGGSLLVMTPLSSDLRRKCRLVMEL